MSLHRTAKNLKNYADELIKQKETIENLYESHSKVSLTASVQNGFQNNYSKKFKKAFFEISEEKLCSSIIGKF